MTDRETTRLLSVVLDGFGYAPLECSSKEDVYKNLSDNTPSVAVVDTRMSECEEICTMIREHGGVSLVVLLTESGGNPREQTERYQADAWESVGAGPEKLLRILRKLAIRDVEAG